MLVTLVLTRPFLFPRLLHITSHVYSKSFLRISNRARSFVDVRLAWIRTSPANIRQPRPIAKQTDAMGDYETILKGKYPAKAHALRVVEYIRSKIPDAKGVLYVESRMTKMIEDNDEPEPFRYSFPSLYLKNT